MAGETRLRARKWQPNVSAMCPSGQIWGSRQGLTAGRRAGEWQPAAHLAPSRGQHGPRGQRISQLRGEKTSPHPRSRHEKMALREGVWSPHFESLQVYARKSRGFESPNSRGRTKMCTPKSSRRMLKAAPGQGLASRPGGSSHEDAGKSADRGAAAKRRLSGGSACLKINPLPA